MIPFLISSVIVGIPYALLEVSLGQWMKEGGIGAWNLTPIFKGLRFEFEKSKYLYELFESLFNFYVVKGIGFANLIIVFFANVYYEVILAWSLLYLLDSFGRDLPWKYCSNKWNTPCCNEGLLYGTRSSVNLTQKLQSNITKIAQETNVSECTKIYDPITEYWE